MPRLGGHIVVALSAWVGRLITAAAQLCAVRLLLRQIGTDRYSAWAVLVSLTSWFLLSDLGMGQALQNIVARRRARGGGAHAEVRTVVGTLLGCGLLLAVLVVLGSSSIADLLLKASVPGSDERRLCVIVSGLMLIAGSWTTFAAKIWYAQGHGVRANLMPTIAALCGLAAIAWLAPAVPMSARLLVSLYGWLLPPALVGLVSLVWIYAAAVPEQAAPAREPVHRRALAFWSYALLGVATLNVDYLILARAVPPSELVSYNLLSKLFGFLFFFYTATLAAFSPSISSANATGRLASAYATLKRHMLACSAAFFVAMLGFWEVLPHLLSVGFHASQVCVSPSLFIAMAALYFIRIWADGYAMFLGAIDQFGLLGRFLPLQAMVSIPLQAALAFRFGALGVVMGLVISYLLTVSWGFPFLTRPLIGRAARTA